MAADAATYDCPYGRWGVSAQGTPERLTWGATYKGNKNYGRLEKVGFRNSSRAGGQQGTTAALCLLRLCFTSQDPWGLPSFRGLGEVSWGQQLLVLLHLQLAFLENPGQRDPGTMLDTRPVQSALVTLSEAAFPVLR